MDQPLNILLQNAKMDMIKATNTVMQQRGLPPGIMDGIICSLLADIRSQTASEIVKEANNIGGEKND